MSETDDIDEIREAKKEELQEAATTPDEPVHVESEEHLEELIADNDVVLVDFFAEWCGPCKMMEPAIEAVAADSDAVVAKVDIDELQALAQDRGIQGVPTLFVYANGELQDRKVGAQNEEGLFAAVEAHT